MNDNDSTNDNSAALPEAQTNPEAPAVVPPEKLIHSSTDRLPERPYTERLPGGTVVDHN